MLRIYLFGSFRLSYQGEPVRFASLPRTLPLWAYLLLNQNPIGRDQLANLFWPDLGESEARSNLRRHLHDLRRALPPPAPDQPWLLSEEERIRWNPAADAWLDVAVFEQSATDPTRLAEVVAVYVGDLLPNLYEDWIFFHRERLRVRFFDCLVGLMQQAHEREDFARAIRYAQQILQHDPIREDVVRQLMTLRHLSGDRAGALREYQQFAHRLREELDVPPMLETSALYDSIAQQSMAVVARGDRQTPALPATPSISAPVAPVVTSDAAPNNLPAQLTTFIGREAELAAVQQWLLGPGEMTRLLTLTGPGGSGKTRLALEAGARLAQLGAAAYPAGVFVVWLATVPDPDLVIPTLANTLNVSESVGKSLLETLQDYLRHRRMLLILDNLEHLTAAARQLATLLTAAPSVQMIVTSRALLRLYGEQEYSVPALSLPPNPAQVRLEEVTRYAALALFIARSRAVNPNFVLNAQNLPAVVAICHRLDGLPLAIELAAARSKLFTPQAILARLDRTLVFLGEGSGRPGARGLPDRHQTLRATLDWSFALLEAADQRLFTRLGVFVGDFSLEQAEAVCDIEQTGDTLDRLETLINNSLLRQFEVDGEIYFRMLATLQEYATSRLLAGPEIELLRARHAAAFLALAQEIAPRLHGPQQASWLRKLESAHANLRAALTWASQRDQASLALPLATALSYFWGKGGHLPEGRRWMADVLSLVSAQTATTLRAAALNAAAWLETAYTDVDQTLATAYYSESIAIIRQLDDDTTLADALVGLGATLYATDLAHAQKLIEEGLELARRRQNRRSEAAALAALARAVTQRGDPAQGRWLIDQSVALYRAMGDPWSIGHTLIVQGVILHFELQLYADARELYAEAIAIAQATNDKTIVALAQVNLADLALVDGDYALAEDYAGSALPILQELGELWQPPRLLRMLGLVAAHAGDRQRACRLISESIELNRRLNDQRAVIAGLVALAYLALCQGQFTEAVRGLAVVEHAIKHYHAQLLPADLAIRRRTLQTTQLRLSASTFAEAWAGGERLTLDEAITVALREGEKVNL